MNNQTETTSPPYFQFVFKIKKEEGIHTYQGTIKDIAKFVGKIKLKRIMVMHI